MLNELHNELSKASKIDMYCLICNFYFLQLSAYLIFRDYYEITWFHEIYKSRKIYMYFDLTALLVSSFLLDRQYFKFVFIWTFLFSFLVSFLCLNNFIDLKLFLIISVSLQLGKIRFYNPFNILHLIF